MSPEHSNELMMNNECGFVHCDGLCSVNVAKCLVCFETFCQGDPEACKHN